MKAHLAPKHIEQVGTNYVLWFENSNSYTVVSKVAYQILITYLTAPTEIFFLENLNELQIIKEIEIPTYVNDLSRFLKDINAKPYIEKEIFDFFKIPFPKKTNYYNFGGLPFSINFSSDKLLQLIHPHLKHGVVKETETECVFDFFEMNNLFYLYKNKQFIVSYVSDKSHFLQGKFAMELTATLHNNNVSDWMATFHASTVCNENEAIMLIGDSGNGKSTLSALLMAHGWDLLSDDFTPMLAKNQHVYRFPAAISIKKGAFETVGSLYENFYNTASENHSSKNIRVKYLAPNKSFHNSKKNFECNKIVLVNYSSGAATEMKECSAELILQTLIPDAWISPNPDHSRKFLNWLTKLKFYQLSYSDKNSVIAEFSQLLPL